MSCTRSDTVLGNVLQPTFWQNYNKALFVVITTALMLGLGYFIK